MKTFKPPQLGLCHELAVSLILVLAAGMSQAQPPPAALAREANTTLRLPTAPPMANYFTPDALGGLVFTNPVALAFPRGETKRLFIVERAGRILVITNLATPTRTVFLDISRRVNADYATYGLEGLASLAFHPGYATNRYFYVVYTLSNRLGMFNRLSRFECEPANPNLGLPNSEVALITQKDEGYSHDFNDLHFGPDGYLYLATGDEGESQDQFQNSQRIDKDFFSGILRIDVDQRPGSLPPNLHPASSLNYAIPSDNPFIGATNFNGAAVDPAKVRTEFYAVGLRNPWRMSFDSVTGVLYCGDVGQHATEEIDVILKGASYGWAYVEGTRPGFRGDPPPGVRFVPPLLEYEHGFGSTQGKSVTGGLVYRGERIPQLQGAYVFADYASGHIWALRYDERRKTFIERLASNAGIAGFGVDPRNGDVLMANHDEGKIRRLEPQSAPVDLPIPPTLADTGAFRDLNRLVPEAGIVPYDVNVPFWSDHAVQQRWFSLPKTNLAIGFSREGHWTFPAGTVWIKHFALELTNGVPESARRLETRFLIRSAEGVFGFTYRWDDSQTNATLVAEEGREEAFLVQDGGTARTQIWRYPGRSECLACHTPLAGYALGFNAAQLNRDFNYGGHLKNQIRALNEAGYFGTNITTLETLRSLAHPTNTAHSVEYRVRSYLAVHCAPCHQPGGSGSGFFDARISTPTSAAGLINGPLLHGQEYPEHKVIRPGSLELSVLLSHISAAGPERMPPITSRVLDTQAIHLLSAWITNDLPQHESFAAWQIRFFESTNAPAALALADTDADGAPNLLEYLTGQSPLSASDIWKITIQRKDRVAQIGFAQRANRGFEVQATTNLLDPASWQPLDVLANRPFFSATNRLSRLDDFLTNAPAKFYRVRVFEP